MNSVLFFLSQPGSFWTAIVWAVIPGLVVLWGIWLLDRYEKEPLRLLGLALLFGAILAPLLAYGIEKGLGISTSFSVHDVIPQFQLGPGLPIVEELVRAAAVFLVILLVRSEIDDVLDGIIYGGVVGVGFGAAANFVSIWETPSLGGSAVPSLYTTAISQLNHVFYGAVIGLAIGLYRRGSTSRMAAGAALGAAAAIGLHLLHDYLPSWGATSATAPTSDFWDRLANQAPNYIGIVALAVIAHWAIGREKVIVGQGLKDEVENGVVTASDYANVTNSFRRTSTLWSALFARGERVWRLRRRLYALEVELAFRKYHRREDTSMESRHFLDEDEYRQEIKKARSQLAGVDPAYGKESAAKTPAAPTGAFVAGFGGLVAFALVVTAGILIWVLALRPATHPSQPSVAGRSLQASDARKFVITVYICPNTATYLQGGGNACYVYRSGYGWDVPAGALRFSVVIRLQVSKNYLGSTISDQLYDKGTGAAVATEYRCRIAYLDSDCSDQYKLHKTLSGLVANVVVRFNGSPIKFSSPTLIHFK